MHLLDPGEFSHFLVDSEHKGNREFGRENGIFALRTVKAREWEESNIGNKFSAKSFDERTLES